MAVWAANAWQRIARWMDDGPPANPPPRRRRAAAVGGAAAADADADAWVPTLVDRLRPWARDAAALMRLADASTLLTRRSSSSSSLDLGWSGPPQLREAARGVIAALLGALLGSERAPAVTIEQAPAEVRVEEEAEPSTPPVETLTGEAPVGYLGSSLASCDLDGDGEVDLAAGAYGDGQRGAAQRGAVVVTYANGTRVSLALSGQLRSGDKHLVADATGDGLVLRMHWPKGERKRGTSFAGAFIAPRVRRASFSMEPSGGKNSPSKGNTPRGSLASGSASVKMSPAPTPPPLPPVTPSLRSPPEQPSRCAFAKASALSMRFETKETHKFG